MNSYLFNHLTKRKIMNLLSAFKDLAGDQLADVAGNFLGASSSETSSAMDAVLPALMGGLLGKVTDEKSAGGLLDFIGNNNLGGGLLDNIGDLFGSGESSSNLLGLGGTVLNFLMGNKTNAMIDLLTKVTGMDNTKMGNLIKIAAPLLMSFIGKKATTDKMGAGGLLSLLSSQKDYVKEAAPAGLLDSLKSVIGAPLAGITDAASSVASNASEGVGSAAGHVADASEKALDAGKGGLQKLLPWLVLILAALGLFWLLKGCNGDAAKDAANTAMDKTEQMADKTGSAVKGAAEATADAAGKAGDAVAGAFQAFELPNGYAIKTKTGSFINKINDYVAGEETDAKKRFTFDGVTFGTGSASITKESAFQLDNLATMMNAYKKMQILVEGHTDNTGDAAANLKLSEQRALAIKKYLMDLDIASARINAQGIGQVRPIASNDTDEGRAQNRRIDVYITKK